MNYDENPEELATEKFNIERRLVKLIDPSDKELFRRGFIMVLGGGCALPIAILLSTITGIIMWFIIGVLVLGL